MENSGQTKVLFCCAKCGAAYQAIQQRSPVRATGSFKCQVCRETLHSWAGRYDYLDWKAIDA
jgi:predicted SprT family Zn-dependent metalloprotease